MHYWNVILIQLVYVAAGLAVAITLWKVLPEANHAAIDIKQWKFGGAFAGFVFVFLTLLKTGPAKDVLADVRALQQNPNHIKVLENSNEITQKEKIFSGFSDSDCYEFYIPPTMELNDSAANSKIKLEIQQTLQRNCRLHILTDSKKSYDEKMIFYREIGAEMRKDLFQDTVKIKYLAKAELPQLRFVLGRKNNVPVIIMYVKNMIVYIEGSEELFFALKKTFIKTWQSDESNATVG